MTNKTDKQPDQAGSGTIPSPNPDPIRERAWQAWQTQALQSQLMPFSLFENFLVGYRVAVLDIETSGQGGA